MKRKIFTVLAILVILTGLVLLFYPMISNMLYQRKQQDMIEYYDNLVYERPKEELDSMWEDCRIYNEGLLDHTIKLTDPFDEERLLLDEHPYIDLLNINGDGAMGSIEIPAINCNLVIYHNTDETVLEKGIGHLQGTSLPVGGIGTHAVLSGHTGNANKELFTNLDRLEAGDVFYLHILGETLAYQVDNICVVLPDETGALAIDRDKDYVTLVTCTPYGINSHRLLVRGTRIPYEEAQAIEQNGTEKAGSTWKRQYVFAIITGIGIVAVIVLIIFLLNRIRRRNNKE